MTESHPYARFYPKKDFRGHFQLPADLSLTRLACVLYAMADREGHSYDASEYNVDALSAHDAEMAVQNARAAGRPDHRHVLFGKIGDKTVSFGLDLFKGRLFCLYNEWGNPENGWERPHVDDHDKAVFLQLLGVEPDYDKAAEIVAGVKSHREWLVQQNRFDGKAGAEDLAKLVALHNGELSFRRGQVFHDMLQLYGPVARRALSDAINYQGESLVMGYPTEEPGIDAFYLTEYGLAFIREFAKEKEPTMREFFDKIGVKPPYA